MKFLLPLLFLASGCGPSPEPRLVVLRQPFARGDGYPLALASGRLILRSGCIAVESPRMPDGRRYTTILAFPHGYRMRQREGIWEVVDTTGKVRGRIGEAFSAGGGEISGSPEGHGRWAAERVGEEAVARCKGPIFAVNPTGEEIQSAPERRF